MPWWEIIGWTGSALVVISLIVPSLRKFRTLNLIGSAIATIYNIAFGIWPYAAMNAIISLIDLYWLIKLMSAKKEYTVIPAEPSSQVVQGFIRAHVQELARTFPGFEPAFEQDARALLVMSGDEIAGLFAYTIDGVQGRIVCDFVTERHRDLTPGRALYSDENLRNSGISRLVIAQTMTNDPRYFAKMGFRSEGNDLIYALSER